MCLHAKAVFAFADFCVYGRCVNMRIMGLDYGSKTVGVAVCDPGNHCTGSGDNHQKG